MGFFIDEDAAQKKRPKTPRNPADKLIMDDNSIAGELKKRRKKIEDQLDKI